MTEAWELFSKNLKNDSRINAEFGDDAKYVLMGQGRTQFQIESRGSSNA